MWWDLPIVSNGYYFRNMMTIQEAIDILAHLLQLVTLESCRLVGSPVTEKIWREDAVAQFGEEVNLVSPII